MSKRLKYNPFLKFQRDIAADTDEIEDVINSFGASNIGVTLENTTSGIIYGLDGIKNVINADEKVTIPQDYEYNTHRINVEGEIIINGELNIL